MRKRKDRYRLQTHSGIHSIFLIDRHAMVAAFVSGIKEAEAQRIVDRANVDLDFFARERFIEFTKTRYVPEYVEKLVKDYDKKYGT